MKVEERRERKGHGMSDDGPDTVTFRDGVSLRILFIALDDDCSLLLD